MEKKDLKAGDIVKYYNNEIARYLPEITWGETTGVFLGYDGYMPVDRYTQDLKVRDYEDNAYSISSVFRYDHEQDNTDSRILQYIYLQEVPKTYKLLKNLDILYLSIKEIEDKLNIPSGSLRIKEN